jgi:hypothetical protein
MPEVSSELDLVLTGSPGHVQRWFTVTGLVLQGGATAFAELQSFQAANGLVTAVDPLVHRLAFLANEVVKDERNDIAALLHVELAGVVGGPWFGSSGSFTADVGLGLTARFRIFISEVGDSKMTTSIEIAPMDPAAHGVWRPLAGYAVSYVAAASLDRYSSEREGQSYRYKLDRIQSLLGLRSGEMTQLLEVSREGLRKWQAGSTMAPERSSRVDDLYNFATWLATHVRPEAIPAFMRRRIQALGGETPLDWLRTRRWNDLRRVYERAFSLEVSR